MATQTLTIDITTAAAFLKSISDASDSESAEELSKFLSEVMYLGFDPMNTLAAIMQHAKDNKLEGSMHKDILTLLRVTLIRGTKADATGKSMFTRMSAEGKARIQPLILKWNIVTNKHASALGPYDVTLGRLIACFSPLVARLLKDETFYSRSSYANVPMTEYEDLESPKILPNHLRFPGSNSLYAGNKQLQGAYMAWSRNFTLMINPKKSLSEEEEADLMERSDKFAEVTRNSPICAKFGITEKTLKQIVAG